MSTEKLSQKEYLKKYMSGNDSKKKKKKKKNPTHQVGLRIVDDDVDLKNMRLLDDNEIELYNLTEDAPQIVGIIDERPEELKSLEEFRTKRWKIVSDESGVEDFRILASERQLFQKNKKNVDDSPGRNINLSDRVKELTLKKKENDKLDNLKTGFKSKVPSKFPERFGNGSKETLNKSDSDESPPRKSQKNNDSDISPPRKLNCDSDSDFSPPRKSNNTNTSPSRKSKHSSHPDLIRKTKTEHNSKRMSSKMKSLNNFNSDASPNQKHSKMWHRNTSSRHTNYDSNSDEISRRTSLSMNCSNDTHRKKYENFDSKPKQDSDSDGSSQRYRECSLDKNISYNKKYIENKKNEMNSCENLRNSPFKSKTRNSDYNKGNNKKEKKTLDGMKAGLQTINELQNEILDFQKREKAQLEQFDEEMFGKGATPIVRDRKTGKQRDLKKEARDKLEKAKTRTEYEEKYVKWGKGLKQVEDQDEKLKQDLYEMTKPLARYADDADLEKLLKEQEREGDPMLAYIQSKKKEETKKGKPKYEGSYLPNRFNIPPGYRWDGVDRSNGYEKKWFEELNAKKAREEEAYKWSTSDM